MALLSKSKDEIFIGKVTRFNFNKPFTTYKIFWLEGQSGRSGYCKGNEIIEREIHIGSNLKLVGYWQVDPKYPSYGEQFFFKNYEVISSFENEQKKQYETHRQKPQIQSQTTQEEVIGKVVKFTYLEGNSRIFELRTPDKDEFYCVGYLIPNKDIYEDYEVKLYGKWDISLKRPEFGKQFYYSTYEIISEGKQGNIINRRKEKTPQTTGANIGNENLLLSQYLTTIGQKKLDYEFHKPKYNTIAQHVKKQLHDRVIDSTPEEKDFYFLTALLDRNVRDDYCQWFRTKHPMFKEELLSCWQRDERDGILQKAVEDIRGTINNSNLINKLRIQNEAFGNLLSDLPGNYDNALAYKDTDIINQILLCLKIITEKLETRNDKHIEYYLADMDAERGLRKYIYGLFGIGPKLSSWAITNVTGHWFVIDIHIQNLIEKNLMQTIPNELAISSDNADRIFNRWFGFFDEEYKCYSSFSKEQFRKVFPDFEGMHYEYLPFIITQYLWFYKFRKNKT